MQMKKFINDPDNLTAELLEGLAMANPDILELGEDNMVINKKLAEADRVIDPETIIRRTVQYGLAHCPELDREEQYARCLAHLQQKYAEGGYLRLWIAESENARRLEELRGVIRDPQRLRKMFDAAFDTETAE